MGFFRWISRIFQRKQKLESTKVRQLIQPPKLITPKEFYNDCIHSLSSKGGEPDEYHAPYLQVSIRTKADDNSLRRKYVRNSETWHTKIIREGGEIPKILLTDGDQKIVLVKLSHSYESFIRNRALPDLLIQVMMTPLLVMIHDLQHKGEGNDFSWYHAAKEKLESAHSDAIRVENLAVTDKQKARVAAVISRIKLFKAELEKVREVLIKYCEDSIDYLKTLRGFLQELIAEELITRLEKGTEETTKEITAKIREKYDVLEAHTLRINAGIAVFDTCTNEKDLSEISQDTLNKLEQERAKLQTSLDEIRKSYFGDAIVAHGKEIA